MTNLLGNTRRPDVSFYANGRIDITARVAKILELHEGDVIDIAIDDCEYMLYRKHLGEELVGRHEAQCHLTKRGLRRSYNIRAYSKRLCSAILDAANAKIMVRIPIGTPVSLPNSGTAAVPLIYKHNLAET